MNTEVIQQPTTLPQISPEIIQALVLQGDLGKMNDGQKVEYYNNFCQSLGLNPLTQPFQIIKFQGKEKLYATKDCTDQLRKLYRVSITDLKREQLGDLLMVTAKATDGSGKTDIATGVLSVAGLGGENLSNAIMKAESKAKRRVTLSICGLGILDELETDALRNGRATENLVETLDTTYDDIKTEDVPNELVEAIKLCTTKKEVNTIFSANPELQVLDSFKELVKKRHADIDLELMQAKFNSANNGNS